MLFQKSVLTAAAGLSLATAVAFAQQPVLPDPPVSGEAAAAVPDTKPGKQKKKKKEGREKREAQAAKPAKPAEQAAPEPKKDAGKPGEEKKEAPAPVVTQHQITVRGETLAYTATAGMLTLTKAYGEPRADVFSISYVKDGMGDPAKRPVCFCFNGGPGSSSVWLHLGAFGPRRVVLPEGGTTSPRPPFGLTDNEFTLLPDCDLVFIDPVSTGYSRAEKGEDPRQFHGFREDVESMGDFIRLWVTKNNRWASPKFLMGESYGGIRGAGLSAHLQDRYGMYLNGFIVVSGLFDFGTLSPSDQNDVPYLSWLPAMTGVAHYHKKLVPALQADLHQAVARAGEFARGAYAAALFKGASLTESERDAIATELNLLTSLPKDWILRQNLRINPNAFRQKLLENDDLVVGRFDGRVTGQNGDPSYTVVYGAFATAMNVYLHDAGGLNYQSDRPYEILNSGGVQPWNLAANNEYLEVAGNLAGAIIDNPALQVFIATGYHDLATPGEGIASSVRRMDLPDNLRGNFHWGHYDGGHMMYTNLPSLEKLSADISAFVKQAAP